MISGNQILTAGRLGKNPELKYTREQRPVCFLALAVSTQDLDKPKWHKIVVWGKEAELCNLYLKKGSLLFVQGQNKKITFVNQNGETKAILRFTPKNCVFQNLKIWESFYE